MKAHIEQKSEEGEIDSLFQLELYLVSSDIDTPGSWAFRPGLQFMPLTLPHAMILGPLDSDWDLYHQSP